MKLTIEINLDNAAFEPANGKEVARILERITDGGVGMSATTLANGQKLSYRLELDNGETAQPMLYIKRIMRGQDLEQWKGNPGALSVWVRATLADYFARVRVVIVTTAVTAEVSA